MTSFLLLIALIGDGRVVEHTSETYYVNGYVEINYYDTGGGYLQQIIIKEWIEEKNTHISMKFYVNKDYSLTHSDGPYKYKFAVFLNSSVVYIYCKYFIETWTTYDPELLDRDIIGKDLRDSMYKPRKTIRSFLKFKGEL